MTSKFDRKHHAVGHWGRPWKRVELDQTAPKIRVMLQDKLITRGRWCRLWLPVGSTTSGVVPCTCVKASTDTADRTCLTCYGTKYAPGYQKFLTETLFWASAEHASFTLTGAQISTAKKANLVVLTNGETTGIVETQEKAYTNPNEEAWEVRVDAYLRSAGATLTLEYSIDSGASWDPVALTTQPLGYTGSIAGADLGISGNIAFRVTLTRVSASDATPAFEILRMRRVRTEDENPFFEHNRTDWASGSILMLSPWVTENDGINPGQGRVVEHPGDKTWTSPLDFFDTSITADTPPCRIDDGDAGPHPFYRYSRGIQTDTTYVLTRSYWNEKLGIFTHQFFDDRRAQDEENPYSLVW